MPTKIAIEFFDWCISDGDFSTLLKIASIAPLKQF